MIYKSKDGDIDLAAITRLYPAAVIEMYGEVAEMSLEWMEGNGDKVKLLHYVLVFDLTPLSAEVKEKKTLVYETREELIDAMTEVAQFFDN
ncbi:MAG: putative nucleotidyltransferase [Sulfurimonas sp.]|jgi:predicted nucleotidyltransferase|uniref:hypothetical protein n=1 Tax=Sulfurimonas sp. TaxID=2022749 RepID=UPI0039E6F37C